MNLKRRSLEDYFILANFHDLLPLATQIADNMGYDKFEMAEAICKVHSKFQEYPPRYNRTAWFSTVFKEKLVEARGDILSYKANRG